MASKSTRRAGARRRASRSRARAAPASPAQLPPGLDPLLLSAMSLRVPARGAEEHRLSGPEIEHALISGEHAQTLEMYFGEAEYAELSQLARRATQRRVRGGPRVLILPGILGSMLARVSGARTDTIWIDFWDILRGRLKLLALPDAVEVRATDVHHATYLKLKLLLQNHGYNAEFHPFDWRRGLPELGRELAQRVHKDAAGEVTLVAHSMGGLVARAALHHGMPKLKQLVMLGTPNFGSFAPAMVVRALYPFLKKIAAIDLGNSAEKLARVFATHPGLMHMLPQRAKYSGLDLYDVEQWPATGGRPAPPLLAGALKAHQQLAVAGEKFVVIAGVDCETTVGLRVAGGEFVLERSRAGDGTVPIELAVLPDVSTYFLAEEHGSLPRNATVHKALLDILDKGSTAQLAQRWDQTRADAVVEVPESELDAHLEAQARRAVAHTSASDLRNVMAELAAPATPATLTPELAAAPARVPTAASAFEALVIGRRRQRRIDVRLARGSVTQIKARAYVLGLFESVAPAGAAGAIDALMDGAISEFRQRRMFSSAVGEVFIVPSGRNDLLAESVLFAGLGHFDTFNLQVLETVAENIARTLARIDIETFATVPIGAGTGLELEPALQALLRGFFRGLEDADPQHSFRAITLCEIDDRRYELLKWALYRLSSTELCEGVEITLTELKLPPAPVARRTGAPGLPPSIYLTVRTALRGGVLSVESSLLTTGAKATVMSGISEVRESELRRHLQVIETEAFSHAKLPQFGTRLAELVLDRSIAAGLQGCAGNHLVVVHDAYASRIPWETLCLAGRFPALDAGMSRRYLAGNLSVAKWLEQRREDAYLDVLLVVNPTRDLAGAEAEGERVQKMFAGRERVNLKRIDGAEATRARLRSEFGSGRYDILHYAGHAFFDEQQVARSGILCADGVLSGAELAEIGNLPSLVFFNACESARVRKRLVRESPRVSKSLEERIERSVGLAEAFLRGGVANYMGTYWPVGDASAKSFAEVFYSSLLEGATLADAAGKARKTVETLKSQDWADYIFYGSADFRVKVVEAPE